MEVSIGGGAHQCCTQCVGLCLLDQVFLTVLFTVRPVM